MCEFDRKEGKNWCFQTVVLEKTLQGPLGRKKIKPVNPKGNQFSSVVQLHLTLCNPMVCSMPGFPVLRYLPEFVHTRTYWVGDAIPLSSVVPFSSCHLSFPASGSFQMNQLFTSGGQSIGVSSSASVLPVNIQDWFPLRLTGWLVSFRVDLLEV